MAIYGETFLQDIPRDRLNRQRRETFEGTDFPDRMNTVSNGIDFKITEEPGIL